MAVRMKLRSRTRSCLNRHPATSRPSPHSKERKTRYLDCFISRSFFRWFSTSQQCVRIASKEFGEIGHGATGITKLFEGLRQVGAQRGLGPDQARYILES